MQNNAETTGNSGIFILVVLVLAATLIGKIQLSKWLDSRMKINSKTQETKTITKNISLRQACLNIDLLLVKLVEKESIRPAYQQGLALKACGPGECGTKAWMNI